MTTHFAVFAEVERDLISERTCEGLARAKSSSRKLGRPKGSLGVSRLDGKEDEIRRFLELGVSKTAVVKLTGVPDRLYSFMSTRGLRPRPTRPAGGIDRDQADVIDNAMRKSPFRGGSMWPVRATCGPLLDALSVVQELTAAPSARPRHHRPRPRTSPRPTPRPPRAARSAR